MAHKAPITRRLLLGHGVGATLMLPAALAEAASQRHKHGHKTARPTRDGQRETNRDRPIVMLDPGHGGKDPGAIGVSGTYEKHIAFAAATELRHQLERDGRYKVLLTRGRDIFIPLEERVAIAQAKGAALFVSMHADALTDHSVRGASVYTLSNTASDAQTAALARRENDADRFGGPHFGAVPAQVAQILASLVRRETAIGSAHFAHSVVASLGGEVPMLDNPSRHAAFVVLKAADIPSVLVEMGFMSNPQDEAALRKPAHRAQVAAAMKRAVDGYFAGSVRLVG